jgi:hypothetical protein
MFLADNRFLRAKLHLLFVAGSMRAVETTGRVETPSMAAMPQLNKPEHFQFFTKIFGQALTIKVASIFFSFLVFI